MSLRRHRADSGSEGRAGRDTVATSNEDSYWQRPARPVARTGCNRPRDGTARGLRRDGPREALEAIAGVPTPRAAGTPDPVRTRRAVALVNRSSGRTRGGSQPAERS